MRQFVTIENHLKMIRNALFYVKSVLVIVIIVTSSSLVVSYAEKQLDKKALVNLKLRNVKLDKKISIHIISYSLDRVMVGCHFVGKLNYKLFCFSINNYMD